MSEVKMKKCKECPTVLPEDQFPRVTARGRTYYQPRCPECHRRYAPEYYQKEKRRIGEIRKARREGDEQTAHELLKRTQAAR